MPFGNDESARSSFGPAIPHRSDFRSALAHRFGVRPTRVKLSKVSLNHGGRRLRNPLNARNADRPPAFTGWTLTRAAPASARSAGILLGRGADHAGQSHERSGRDPGGSYSGQHPRFVPHRHGSFDVPRCGKLIVTPNRHGGTRFSRSVPSTTTTWLFSSQAVSEASQASITGGIWWG